ncbi:hypothetical protein DSECCO2_131950 [anaerobic digester metagenome]
MNTPDNGLQRVLAAPQDDLETVWKRLLTAIESAKIPVFSIVDHKQNAVEAGLDMAGARVITFGNPAVGTALMLEAPEAALDLPLRMLTVETPQGVCLLWNDPAWIASRHGIVKNADVAQKMQNLMERLARKAAQHQAGAGGQ